MSTYEIDTYGDRFSTEYDRVYAGFPPYPGQIEFLRGKARSRRALELGAGTGRIAIPLSETGVPVLGIDSSQKMLDALEQRSDGLPIATMKADAADFTCGAERFDLVFAVFNFVFLLPSRTAQLNCFKSVANALADDGEFVIETFVPIPDAYLPDGPNPGYFPAKSGVSVRSVDDAQISLFTSVNNAEQKIWTIQEVLLSPENGIRFLPCVMHYLDPEEIDALAGEAGLCLAQRFEDWSGTPFSASSRKHVSVYARKPATH
ncbi:SAM-dependent methyltransferase [Burkholderia lata]|uniref:SAM-dependent methyltransferase n=1 Tax=Burkholderia lata (strain ATCC 17760 / DSM 23089 / LMG 22485 / NCIMB 9086 / R18194 / 383) TaxID=482957 RepID=A0A6P2X9U9_BURL3|nr:class I SAM-dependent methyltransferase [Burkholderia lata]VWD05528.1 SAM-dependent methyltransferase [Burkholderia lata]